MLLIPDIHINHKYSDQILYHIDLYILDNPEEKDIVFLGDYVYMFNLDTNAINRLLDLFIKHFHNGKNIYILAGNHDRIKSDFVYSQAKKVFDILNKTSINKIYFITEPMITNIQGKDILFLPYMISKQTSTYDQNKNIYYQNFINPNQELPEDNIQNEYIDDTNILSPISQTILDLKKHKNYNHQMSGEINHIIYTAKQSYDKLVIIHHYYMHGVDLPGVQSRFDYGSVALSPFWLQDKDIYMISGHIHSAFQTQNYLCCGSVWYTGNSEIDQIKFLRKRDISQDKFLAEAIYINPNILLNFEDNLTTKNNDNNQLFTGLFVDIEINNLTTNIQDILSKPNIDLKFQEIIANTKRLFYDNVSFVRNLPNLKDISVYIYNSSDKQIEIPQELFATYKDIKIKKKSIISNITNIDTSNLDLKNTFASRQLIAKNYISDKYKDQASLYFDYLKKIDIQL